METQADEIREAIGKALRAAKEAGAIEVIFRAENISQAVAGTRSNHPNVIRALTTGKMQDQTGFSPGVPDREYSSSSALISFKL